jgi:hypothetical protein
MGTTVVGPASVKLTKALVPLVYVKSSWSGSWQYRPDIRLREALLKTGGDDMGRCVIERRYGSLQEPQGGSMSTKVSINLDGYWIQIRLASNVLWTGTISNASHAILGSDVARSGLQSWAAFPPLQILRKKNVSHSWWVDAGEEVNIGWVPNINTRDEYNTLYGNRSDGKGSDGVYLYGGTSVWTHYDAAEYILKKFADSEDGPKWKLGGQMDALKEIKNVVPMQDTQTVADVLAYLISPRLGLDYKIIPAGSGFEIHVFALIGEGSSFSGMTLPQNSNKVRVRASETRNMIHVEMTRDSALRYDKIRVFGQRMVLCSSLWGADTNGPEDARFEKKWTDALETEYKAGTGTPADYKQDHDKARSVDKLEAVYRVFGATKDNYNAAAPELDENGEVVGGEQDCQTSVRETLHFIPLREGFDYTSAKPKDNNPPGFQPSLLSPTAYLKDVWARNQQLTGEPYVRADEDEISVSILWDEWGIKLGASPAHRMALDKFALAADTETWPENGGYDYEDMVMTIARRADQRLGFAFGDPDGEAVKDIFVSSAELWLLMPGTVVGVDSVGKIEKSPDEIVTLRNDATYLKFVMAGAIARYYQPRARASVTLNGLQLWGGLLGQILTVIEESGDTEKIEAPITSVHWFGGESPKTTIGAGFAL